LRGAASIGLGTTIKYLRSTLSGAAGNGLGTTIKYRVDSIQAKPTLIILNSRVSNAFLVSVRVTYSVD